MDRQMDTCANKKCFMYLAHNNHDVWAALTFVHVVGEHNLLMTLEMKLLVLHFRPFLYKGRLAKLGQTAYRQMR